MTRSALIISHGQPSDPAPAEADLAQLAARVAAHLPGWRVGSATLAAPGALARAVAALGPDGVAYPMFMADGWFSQTHLPQRLAEAGARGWHILPPFGTDPAVQALCLQIALEAGQPEVLLAAHGSFRSPAPALVADKVASQLRSHFRRVNAYFIDQDPRIASATGYSENAICLPFFAAAGDHITHDLPRELAKAGFPGRTLPPLGLHPQVPGLIARRVGANPPPR